MSVVSKNLYELLGNDPELDPNREPEPPTKAVDKPLQRAGKRNGASEAPVKDTPSPAAGARGGRREQFTGSEQAARDKNAGSSNNRAKPVDDGLRRDRHPDRVRDSEGGRGRGSRGGRGQGRAPRGDRHDRSGVAAPHANDKQAAHGWGGETGDAEYSDEKAGLADARAEEKEGGVVADSTTPVNAEGESVPVEEDNTKSYEQYLAEQLEKKAALGGASLAPRKANEGSSKKFPEGKAFARDAAEDFVVGTGGKAKRDRERKTKEVVDIDLSWKEEQAERASRGGERGAERGGERGGARGGRGRGGPRGGPRGGARGGDRPERSERTERAPRAPRGGAGASPNVTSSQDFPSLS